MEVHRREAWNMDGQDGEEWAAAASPTRHQGTRGRRPASGAYGLTPGCRTPPLAERRLRKTGKRRGRGPPLGEGRATKRKGRPGKSAGKKVPGTTLRQHFLADIPIFNVTCFPSVSHSASPRTSFVALCALRVYYQHVREDHEEETVSFARGAWRSIAGRPGTWMGRMGRMGRACPQERRKGDLRRNSIPVVSVAP